MHRFIILAGTPGSGKTTIAKHLEQEGFVRLAIDEFYKNAQRDPHIMNWQEDREYVLSAYTEFERAIMEHLERGENVVVETSGLGERWRTLFEKLKSIYPKLASIYLKTSRQTALGRIAERNANDPTFKMTEEDVDRFFTIEKDIPKMYQHVIDADRPSEDVIREVREFISQTSAFS
jgi:predicted kinase